MDTLTTKPDTTGVISGMEGGKNLSSSPDMVSLTRLVYVTVPLSERHSSRGTSGRTAATSSLSRELKNN